MRAFKIVLLGLGLAYAAAAFSRLVADVPGSFPIDLQLRWMEHRFLWQRLNPQQQGHPGMPPSHAAMEDQGGSYPPWSYAIGSALVPPLPFAAVRWYYAVLCAAALSLLTAWAYRVAGVWGALSVPAIFAGAICISYGQYAIVCTALVAGSAWLIERNRPYTAGLLLGLAAVKPQLVALFLLTLFLRRRYRPIASAALVIVAATVLACWLAKTPPWEMLTSFGAETGLYYWLSHNPLLPWLTAAVGYPAAVTTLAAAGVLAVVGVWVLTRGRASLAHGFAVAAVASMYWSYRKHYDSILMALVLVPLVALAAREPCRRHFILCGLLGLSLWLPIRDDQWHWTAVEIGHLILWPAAAAALVAADRRKISGT